MTALVVMSPDPILQFFNNKGQPNVGGTVLTQVGGVNYPTYQDPAGATPLPNPIPLNSRGEISNAAGASCQLFLVQGVTYTFTLYDSTGTQLNQAQYVGAGSLIVANYAAAAALSSAVYSGTMLLIASSDGGLFRYDSTDTTTAADGGGYCGTVIVDASNRRWKRDFWGTFNVLWFGAKGDGTTDDAPAFNYCRTGMVAAGSGAFYIPRGTYLLMSLVQFNAGNVKVYGDGIGNTILKYGAWQSGLLFASAGYPSVTAILNGVTVRDIEVNGNQSGFAHGADDTYGNGINLNGCDRVLVENCYVHDMQGQGIVSTYFSVAGSVQTSLAIVSNVIANALANQTSIGVDGNSLGVKVVNNSILNAAGVGINVENIGGSGTGGKTVVTGNYCVSTGAANQVGIEVNENDYNAVINGNICESFDIGIRCSQFTAGSTYGYAINSNIILNYTTAGILPFPMNGTDTNQATIVGNRVVAKAGSAGTGISSVFGATVTGNYVLGVVGTLSGITASGKAAVCGNYVTGGVKGIIASGNNNAITGNHIDSTSSSSIDLAATTGNVCTGNWYDFDINFTGLDINDTNLVGMNINTSGSMPSRASWFPMGVAGLKYSVASVAPATGAHVVGEHVANNTPVVGQPKGWFCTVAGTPGTWQSEGNL